VAFGILGIKRPLAQLPQFDDRIGPGDSAKADFVQKSSLQIDDLQTSRQAQSKLVQQDGLMFGGFADASFADLLTAACG